LEDVRDACAYVSQEPFLFSGTIIENITFTTRVSDPERLDVALRQAALKDTINRFPGGLETIVGEKGVVLSGGQKQRIALARAFYKNAPVFLLDDPVSQVDMQTGATIIQSIQQAAPSKTVIIVSHRLSAVKQADSIIVMDQGRIAKQGAHEELLESNAYYASTYRLQQIEEGAHES
jgi:ATP-binding cassette subfamily B multidrug efflux pump